MQLQIYLGPMAAKQGKEAKEEASAFVEGFSCRHLIYSRIRYRCRLLLARDVHGDKWMEEIEGKSMKFNEKRNGLLFFYT